MDQKKAFKQKIRNTFGELGQRWLDSLDENIELYSKQWDLTDLRPVTNLTYNYVMMGKKCGHLQPVVLKLGVPNNEFMREMAYLAHYDGVSVPRLLASEADKGAMLMTRIMPGTSMMSYFPQDEEAALAITSKVIQQLQMKDKPINHDIFPSIETWHASLMQATASNTIPDSLLVSAKQLSMDLIATSTKQVLLHGDLHHDNLLLGPNEQWVAIDPKGIIGDPVYEVGAFIRNPVMDLRKQTNMQAILRRRIAAFAEYLDFEPQRMIQWSFVQAVLAACWSMEENSKSQAEHFMGFAKLLEKL